MSDETTPVATDATPAQVEETSPPADTQDQTNDHVFYGVGNDPAAIAQNNEAELATSSKNLKADDGKTYVRITHPIYLTMFNTVLKSGETVQISHEPVEVDADSVNELIQNAANAGILIEKVGK